MQEKIRKAEVKYIEHEFHRFPRTKDAEDIALKKQTDYSREGAVSAKEG